MSSERSLQLYSLTLNDEIDTWDDWKIVAVKKPVFFEPELKSDYLDVPGRSESLDLTEVLTGYPLFENRVGTIQFFLYDDSMPALSKLNIIRNYIHGKKHKIILNNEPEYFYIGRLTVSESHPTTEGEYAVFNLDYNLEPYKYEMTGSTEDWLWDPFNFETGVIREYGEIEITGSGTITVIGSRKPTVPKFIVSDDCTVVFNEAEYNLSEGTNIIPTIVLQEGEYEFIFSGNVSVTIEMRAGIL